MAKDNVLDHENAERILQEGWRLFQQKGFRGVSVDELCLKCGLSKPTLYYYFHDKENLFVEVLEHRLKGFHTIIEQPGTIQKRLEAVAASILESFETEYSTLLRDREHIHNPANIQRVKDAFYGEMFGPLNGLMQSGIEAGELKPGHPHLLTLVFLGVINNFIGKSAEIKMDNSALAVVLTRYFLEGAKNE